jgi:error-prone DNA polymerase
MICYPIDRAAWGRLCRLLSLDKGRTAKAACDLRIADLAAQATGQILIIVPPATLDAEFIDFLDRIRRLTYDRLYLAAARRFAPDDEHRLAALVRLGGQYRLGLIAVNELLYLAPERLMLQDVLRCIRLGCPLEQAGTRLEPHGERYLKPRAEMAHLLAAHPDALRNQDKFLHRVTFSLDSYDMNIPTSRCPPEPRRMSILPHSPGRVWHGAILRLFPPQFGRAFIVSWRGSLSLTMRVIF